MIYDDIRFIMSDLSMIQKKKQFYGSRLGHGLQEEALQNASGAEGCDGRGELQTELELLVHFPTLQPETPMIFMAINGYKWGYTWVFIAINVLYIPLNEVVSLTYKWHIG
jgi:hypothetical protein